MKSIRPAFWIIAAALLGPSIRAQAPAQMWSPLNPGAAVRPLSTVATWDADGAGPKPEYLVAAERGGVVSPRVLQWDGMSWRTIGVVYGRVDVLSSYNGELIAGGAFSSIGGVPANNIARWDGAAWRALGSGLGPPPLLPYAQVAALCVEAGTLVAGGSFGSAGGVPASMVARWDGSNWHAVGAGFDGSVSALAAYDGELVAGGSFVSSGGVPTPRIARFDGMSWLPLGSGMDLPVRALAVHTGQLIAGGAFSFAGGIPAGGIARWDGSVWTQLAAGLSGWFPAYGGRQVLALASCDLGLVAGGCFTAAGGTPASGIARWDGATWSGLGSGTNDIVSGIAAFAAGIVAAGPFTTAGGLASPYAARWSTPQPLLILSQPDATDRRVQVTDFVLIGREYFNLVSAEVSPGGPGTGPVGGLTFSDLAPLVLQLSAPLGAAPFHFLATGMVHAFGPYPLPPGIAFEAACLDVTGGVPGAVSPAVRFTVQ